MPHSPPTWRRRVIEWLVVVTVILVMVAVLLPAVRLAQDPNGPHGDPVPTELPDERNRYYHESGISIVLPPNWETRQDSLNLRIWPRCGLGRMPAVLRAWRFDGERPTDLVSMRPTTFQGRPAFEQMVVVRKDTLDDPAVSEYTLCFEHNGVWWDINYSIQDELEVLPDMMRRYIETIRLEIKPEAANDLSDPP
jgi:hypothetical protein